MLVEGHRWIGPAVPANDIELKDYLLSHLGHESHRKDDDGQHNPELTNNLNTLHLCPSWEGWSLR